MKTIPEPSRRRLIKLAQLLGQTKAERLTSVEIQAMTGWSSAVVRRDVSLLGLPRSSSSGYGAAALRDAICLALGVSLSEEKRLCCVVGLGALGEALLESRELENSAFEIAAGFGTSINRMELLRTSVPLYPMSRLESVIEEKKIEYAALAVDSGVAHGIASRLCSAGIKGIVNYSGAILPEQNGVSVENVSLLVSLQNVLK